MHHVLRRLRSNRQLQVFLCAGCGLLCYADRVNLSVAIIPMSSQLHYTRQQQAAIMAAFFWGYLPMQVVGALLCRRFGAKNILVCSAFLTSAFTALTPFAAHLSCPVLVACRMAMGLAEGLAFPAVFHYFASWIPMTSRGQAVSTFLVGAHVGTTFALVVSPKIIASFAWEAVFYLFASLGCLWVFAWVVCAEDRQGDPEEELFGGGNPTRSKNDTVFRRMQDMQSHTGKEYLKPPSDGQAGSRWAMFHRSGRLKLLNGMLARVLGWFSKVISADELEAILYICSQSACLAICYTQFTMSFCHYVILSWLPTYFNKVFDVKTTELWLTCFPYLTMVVTANFGGLAADHLTRRGVSLTTVRKLMTSIAFSGGGLFLLLFSGARSVMHAVALATVALGFISVVTGGFEASYLDVAPPPLVGTFKSVGNTLGALSGVLAMTYTSLVLSLTHESWRAVFGSLSCFFVVGMIVFVCFATAERLPFSFVQDKATSV